MKEDKVYLQHIRESIRRIEENTAGGKDLFLSSHTLQDATLRNLQTMAESTQRLSDVCKAKYPEIDWRRIAAFRNVLAHNYLGIDIELIWIIIQRDLPILKRAVLSIFEKEGESMFYNVNELKSKQMTEGVKIRVAYGEKVMMSYVNIEPNTTIAEHSHPHEQMGMFIEGEAEFTIGDETKVVKPGMAYLIPSNVKHKVITFDKPVLALDIFSPPREEYK